MSKLITYKIDLKPMDVFFFGGEQHFGEGDDANYFVRSNYFPQQSGVLGMLRHQLLIQNDCIPITKENRETATSLIGKESYNIEGNELLFGAIQNISPLFLSKHGELLFTEASEFYIDKKNSPDKLSQIEVEVKDNIGKTIIYPNVENPSVITVGKDYFGKYEIKELLVSKNGDRFNYCFDKEFEGKRLSLKTEYSSKPENPEFKSHLGNRRGKKIRVFTNNILTLSIEMSFSPSLSKLTEM